ncbi:MAG: 2-amino-4-hydroxy-6-hydroxymethyldihydropteridine diphosphokinase [Acidimicrobiia bacterium]
MTRFAVGLGSNLGDRLGHIRGAIESMRRLGRMDGISGLYETEPVGGPEQDPYLNAVAVLDSELSARQLLDGLQAIEADHDRTREVRWGARTLDLDLVALDGEPVDTPDLVVPHPRAAERRFVLEPLAAVWPEALVGDGLTAAEALAAVTDQDVDLLASSWVDDRPAEGRYWVMAQLVFLTAIAIALYSDGSLPGEGFVLVRVIGGPIILTGAYLVLAGSRALGPALTMTPEPAPGAPLVETGVYSRARHPIYGGLSLMMIGISLLLASSVGAALSFALLIFFWAKSGYEERRLRIVHPGYSAYASRVRKSLIPYLF